MPTLYKTLFSGQIDISLKTAVSIFAAYPESASAFARLGKGLKAAEDRRTALAGEGVEIPPLLIVSTTDACNLSCAGCYACARERKTGNELSDERAMSVLDEASELGVSVVMLAGGEPLLREGWMTALGSHGDMAGIVFTNGTLFDKRRCAWFAGHRHVIPAFSIEGGEAQTDARRGSGVAAQVNGAMRSLRDEGVPCGVSLTVTSSNIDDILRDDFVEAYIARGCRLFIFVEYVPVERGTEPLILSAEEKRRLSAHADAFAKKYPALFIPFPGDEEQYGGCLASGRGFVHISADGDVEPCPFAPFSDTNLKYSTLKDALNSGFLAKVRKEHHLLHEGNGGCALWNNRAWLESLL